MRTIDGRTHAPSADGRFGLKGAFTGIGESGLQSPECPSQQTRRFGRLGRLRRLSVDSAECISTDAWRAAAIVSGKEYVGRPCKQKRLDRNDLLDQLYRCDSGSRQ